MGETAIVRDGAALPPEVARLLRKWGRIFGPSRIAEWDEDSSMGLGGRSDALVQLLRVGKGAQSLLQGRSPVWTRDADGKRVLDRAAMAPHQCFGVESRVSGERPWIVDPEAEYIDRLWCQLHRENEVPAIVLRVEYCIYGPRRMKVRWVNNCEGIERVSLRRYASHLETARDWMADAITGKRRHAA